jgi:hypothetical protein
MNKRNDNLIPGGDSLSEFSGHFSLDEIKGCVADRQLQGERWEMPSHLAECPLCLEVFDVVLSGADQVPNRVIRRLLQQVRPPRKRDHFWGAFLLKAALFLFLIGAVFFWMNRHSGPKSMLVVEGSLSFADTTSPVPVDIKLPPNRLLTSVLPVRVRCDDGSDLAIASHTQFELPANAADAAITLKEGEIDFSIVHQPGLRRFRVRTPLGEIIVVGTQFRVTSRYEQVTLFRNDSTAAVPAGETTRLATVRIHVSEGKVLVRNRYQEAAVPAGTTALLRENQPMIDLTRD